jgi:cyclophilin family peptidyl-prolyl cis-trans isomerase
MARKLTLAASFLAVMALTACGQSQPPASVPASTPATVPTPTPKPGTALQWSSPPPMTIDPNKDYTATIDTTGGKFIIKLLPKDAPLAVNNFVFLARQGFYNGVKIHRIVRNFVIQTGDPLGNGTGGPGYKFNDEKVTRDYKPGTVAMANAGPNTNGSQFFICLADLSARLPKSYTIFGEVIEGMDVVLKLGDTPVARSVTGEMSAPTVDVRINSITIQEN